MKLRTVFHHRMDGEAEHTIKNLEYILKACVIDFKGSLDNHLPLIEFSFDNTYHSSIFVAPFDAVYGRRCTSLVGWFEVGDSSLLGSEIIYKVFGKVRMISDRLKTSYNQHKSYTDNRRRDLEFQVRDMV